MKAVLCREFGPPETLHLEDVTPAEMGADEVRVETHYAGVNYPDIVIVAGRYHWKPPFPFVPGLECSGIVKEVGKDVRHVQPGDRVMVSTDPKFITRTGHGSLAEEVVAPSSQTFQIPASMNFRDAAAIPIVYGTSYHALFDRGSLQRGETILVLGAAGGVGLAAVDLARAQGTNIIAAASSIEKLELAKQYGAQHLLDYTKEDIKDAVMRITSGRGADVVFDPVGGDAFDRALRAMAWGGRLLTIGFAAGRIPAAQANIVLLKGCAVVGVNWGQFAREFPERNRKNFAAMLEAYERKELRPHISKEYPITEYAEALKALASRSASGKVLINVRETKKL